MKYTKSHSNVQEAPLFYLVSLKRHTITLLTMSLSSKHSILTTLLKGKGDGCTEVL